jgi:uncharacterized membrane protein YdfJ with MMPL/SSD domain
MVAVLFTFAPSGPLPPKERGIILGIAVLLDAALIRLLLLPVLMRLIGKWSWYLPRRAHRTARRRLRTRMRTELTRQHPRSSSSGRRNGAQPRTRHASV